MSPFLIPNTGLLQVTVPALRCESPDWSPPALRFAPSSPVSILQPKLSFWSLVLNVAQNISHLPPVQRTKSELPSQASQESFPSILNASSYKLLVRV